LILDSLENSPTHTHTHTHTPWPYLSTLIKITFD